MPTENRSRNTEMVSVPRQQLQAWQERFSKAQMFQQSTEIKAALAQQSPQPQAEPVALQRKPWNGLLATADNLRGEGWNACLDEIAKLGPLYTRPVPAVRQDPVAWYKPHWNGKSAEWRLGAELTDAVFPEMWERLYTHADPNLRWKAVADEQMRVIEQLKEEVERKLEDQRREFAHAQAVEHRKWAELVEGLKAQLAEARSLLRECQPCLEKAGYGTWQIDELLSASSEPAALNKFEPVIPGHRLDALDALIADGDPQSDANVSNASVAELIGAVRTLQVRAITDSGADQLAEVERLREDLAKYIARANDFASKMQGAQGEAGTLRAQQAERDALLRDIASGYWELAIELPADLLARLQVLSASAGPSSPTWSCQACQVEQPTDRACDACGGQTELIGAKS